MSNKAVSTILLLLVSFLVTVGMSIHGPILPLIQKDLRLNYVSSGWIFGMIAGGLLVSTLPTTMLGNRFGKKNVLISAVFGVSACQFFISLSKTPSQAYIFLFLTGLFLGPLITIFQSVLSDIHGEQRGRILSLSATFASIGSLSAPIIANIISVIFQNSAWRQVYQTVSFVMLVLGFLLVFFLDIKGSASLVAQPIPFHKLIGLLRDKNIFRFSVVASLGAAIEWSFSFWLVSYLVGARGNSLTASQLMLSVFFGSMLIGRLVNSALARPQYIRLVMVGSSLAGLAGSTLFFLLPTPLIGVCIIGLALSGMYPLSLGQAISFNPNFSTAISAIMVVCVYAVSMVLPVLAGIVSDTQGIAIGIGISLIGFIPLFLLLALGFQTGTAQE